MVLSISSHGELAILMKGINLRSPTGLGTLAQVPLGGDAPKELLRDVFTADWAPDGREMAVIRAVGGKERLEYPIGRVLAESATFHQRFARVSPDGTLLATIEWTGAGAGFQLVIYDRKGNKRPLATFVWFVEGFAWAPDGREIFIVGATKSESFALRAVSLSGRQRVLIPAVGSSLVLHDVSGDGRILLERTSRRNGTACLRAGESGERDVSWADSLELRDVSNDGRTLFFSDLANNRMNTEVVYMRRCDGSPPVRLGEGSGPSPSADGQWVLVTRESGLWLLPTGPGSPRKIPLGELKVGSGGFLPGLPGSQRVLFESQSASGEGHLFVTGLEGHPLQPVHQPNARHEGGALSPDGELLAYDATDGSVMAASLSGGAARQLPGPPLDRGDQLVTWSADGRFLFLVQWRPGPPGVFLRREISTGKTSRWLEFQPADMTGVIRVGPGIITPDGRSYAYSYERVESSDLFVVDGLR